MEFSQSTVDKINLYNLLAACWGNEGVDETAYGQEQAMKKCGVDTPDLHTANTPASTATLVQPSMVFRTLPFYNNVNAAGTYNPYVALGRRKRQAAHDTYEPHSDADLAEYQNQMADKVAKMLCVLKEVKILDANNNIDPNIFSMESLAPYSDTPAGKDPVWLSKYSEEQTNCYNVAMTFPQEVLNKNAFMATHGRKMIYFKCGKQVDIDMCMKFQMNQYLEATTGKELDPAKYGAKDKYDAAAMVARVSEATSSPAAKHIDAFFWGTPETMFDM